MGNEWSERDLDRLGRAVLAAAADAIILADREGVIRFWNTGAERLFGFAPAEALGRPVDIIVPEPQRARHWAGFSRVMETGESRSGAGEVLAVPACVRTAAASHWSSPSCPCATRRAGWRVWLRSCAT